MKFLVNLLFLLFAANSLFAQNMVINGDFEYYTTCPTNAGQTNYAYPWRNYHQGTTDYFHTCASAGFPFIPNNYWGYQYPASGNGHAGLYATFGPPAAFTEYLMAPILPLSAGVTYKVSMSVSLANNSDFACNGLGAWFYDIGPDTTVINNFVGVYPLSITPQVNYAGYGVLADTQNWVRVSSYFIADSAYDHMVIGRFNPPGGLSITALGYNTAGFAYYYIDSVVVKVASGINNLYADSMVCAGDTFQVPYTLNNGFSFAGSNVFTVQLSNASGSFTSGTVNIGSRTGNIAGYISCVVPTSVAPGNNYRVRILSTNSIDTSMPNVRDISIGVVRPVISNANNGPLCLNQQLNLTATSSTTGVSYKWVGPSAFASTLQNPVINNVAVSNSGDYIVAARLYGCVSKDTTTVLVNNASAFTVNAIGSTPICERDTLYLNATVAQAANSYSWAGPGGYVASGKDVIRTNSIPSMSGNYIFTAVYSGCTIYDTVSIAVKPQAAGRTLSNNSPLCSGNTLNLAAGSSSTGVTYTWTGPDSFSAGTSVVSINNVATSNAGKYIVSYLLNGCITKDSVNVVVNQSPIPVVAGANTPVCEGATLNLNCTNSTTGAGYTWAGPGSYVSVSQNPARTNAVPSMSGDYVVTVSLSNGCTFKDTVTVLVKPLPLNVNATVNGPICAGATLFFTGSTLSSGVSFSWVGPGGYTASTQNPNIPSATTANTGNYILSVTLNGCSVHDTVYAQVNPIPITPAASANTPVCVGQDLQLVASTVAGATYNWASTTGFSSNVQNPVRSSATTAYAGKYYVTATVNSCVSQADTVAVVVNPAPVINVYPSPKDSICVGQNVTFVSSSSNTGSSYTRSWLKNNIVIGGAANANYSTATAADGDEYCATITVYGVCATPYTDTSNIIRMHVLPYLAPSVSISANPNTTVTSGTMINFTATPTNGGNKPSYQWTRNGTPVVGAISNIWGASTLSNNDQICVDMTSNYLCPNPNKVKSNCIKVSIESTGIVGVWTGKEPSIYPNPTKDRLVIEGVEKGTKIQLRDVFGRVVIKATAANETTELNMSHLAAGNYMLLLSTDNGDRMTVKVVKE